MQPWKVSVGLTASITAPAAILIAEDLVYLEPYGRAVLDTHWRAITFYGGFAVLTVAFFFYAAARALALADLGRKVDLVERSIRRGEGEPELAGKLKREAKGTFH